MNHFQVTKKLVDFIVQGHLAYDVSQLPALKDLLETVAGRKISMPSRFKFMAALHARFDGMKASLKEILRAQKYLCITTDVWSSRAQSYLGVTVHFLDKLFVRHSHLLAFKELKGKQTYKVLAKALNDVFEDFEIKAKQITNIVTDGGSAFAKMFRVYGAAVEMENMEVENAERIESSEADEDEAIDVMHSFMEDVNGELFASEILNFNIENTDAESALENVPDINEDLANYLSGNVAPVEPQIELPKQRRCMSHSLNLLSKDFSTNLEGMAKTSLVAALNKLHPLWVCTHRSSQAKTICKEILGRCLLVPCETRWNSTYDAVKTCFKPEIQPKMNQLIEALRTAGVEAAKNMSAITSIEWGVISSYLKVMEPIAITLDKMQAESNGNQGIILPLLISMAHHVSNVHENSLIISDFKTCMLKVIERRLSMFMSVKEAEEDLVLAAITTPQFKTDFIALDDDIIYAKNLLITECKKLLHEANIDNREEYSNSAAVTDDFIISFAAMRNTRRTSIENDVESEVARFLVDKRTDIEILNEYPHVKEAFYKYNTTLASSAPVERVFSRSAMVFTPRRNKLNAKNFEETLLLDINRALLE